MKQCLLKLYCYNQKRNTFWFHEISNFYPHRKKVYLTIGHKRIILDELLKLNIIKQSNGFSDRFTINKSILQYYVKLIKDK